MVIKKLKRKRWKYKTGYYKSSKNNKRFRYKSSWEKSYMQYLDSNDNVEKWDYECIKILYLSKWGKRFRKRWYIPDFYVEYKDGRKELIEIGPSRLKCKGKNVQKITYARNYCRDKDLKFKLITEKYLKHIGCL